MGQYRSRREGTRGRPRAELAGRVVSGTAAGRARSRRRSREVPPMISKDTIALVGTARTSSRSSESVPSLKKRGRRSSGSVRSTKRRRRASTSTPTRGSTTASAARRAATPSPSSSDEGYTFLEAVRAARRARGHPHRRGAGSGAERRRPPQAGARGLYGAMQMAATWYEEQLAGTRSASTRSRARAPRPHARRRGGPGLPHRLRARGVGRPDAFLKEQGVSPAVAETVGLSSRARAARATTTAFVIASCSPSSTRRAGSSRSAGGALPEPEQAGAARALSGDPPPKYINSPESPIYTKGPMLFGLCQARHAIRQAEHAPSSSRATSTSSPPRARHRQRRGARSARRSRRPGASSSRASRPTSLLFDGDAAGRKAARAAERALRRSRARREGAALPDRWIPTNSCDEGRRGARTTLGQARGLLEYLIDPELDDRSTRRTLREATRALESRVAGLLARQKDPVVRGMLEAYADYAAGRLDLVRSAPNAFGARSGRWSPPHGRPRVRGASPLGGLVLCRWNEEVAARRCWGDPHSPALLEDLDLTRL